MKSRRNTLALQRYMFTVMGAGGFPMDMLRYDECFPHTGGDAEKFRGSRTERREIVLCAYHEPGWEPEAMRWSSFGWPVKTTVRGYQNEPVSYVEVDS